MGTRGSAVRKRVGSKSRRRMVALVVALATVFIGVITPVSGPAPASAATGAAFDPGYIISDAEFFDGDAMSAGQVQSFLNDRVPNCRAGSAGPTCLRYYVTDIQERAARAGKCRAIPAAQNQSAATVIAVVGNACGISQKALLVLLEKEQGLVGATAPSASRYRIAMGFGCPDTAACDTNYYGFFNQVYSAAAQFKTYATSPGSFGYRAGRTNNIQYHPNAGCGTKPVYIRNQATAGLYIYTPYTPNTASLANIYGTGDACSSYGNRNFWRMYTDWFGSPVDGSSPIGGADLASIGNGVVRVGGWALDPDTTNQIPVHIYVDGVGRSIQANASRPDVGAVYPRHGSDHGISTDLQLANGMHDICVFGIDGTGDDNTLFLCQTVSVTSGSPIGGMDVTTGHRSLQVNGWTIDPDTSGAIDVHVYIDGQGISTPANVDRPDVGAAYPAFGSRHGITVPVQLSPGSHEVCAFGINVGAGSNTLLGCSTVTVRDLSPFGGMDARAEGTDIRVGGWTIDPDTSSPIDVHVYVDGFGVSDRADTSRPDVAWAFPGVGDPHGIDVRIPSRPGNHSVCAFGINVGQGTNTLLGCQDVLIS